MGIVSSVPDRERSCPSRMFKSRFVKRQEESRGEMSREAGMER